MTEAKMKIEGPMPFNMLLERLGGGKCHIDCTDELAALINSMYREHADRGGEVKGTLSLDIILKCGIDGATIVTYKLVRKDPESPRPPSMFFLSRDGLTEENPKQSPLDFGHNDDRPQRKGGN